MIAALVIWKDAHAGTDGQHWKHIEELEDDGNYVVATAGLLLPPGRGGKKGHVSIASSLTNDGHVDYITHIPKRMVLHRVDLYELGEDYGEDWADESGTTVGDLLSQKGRRSWRRRRAGAIRSNPQDGTDD